MNRRLAVRAVILHEDKLLCVKLKGYAGTIPGDYWCLPGGTVEEGEALLSALQREMIEETNITPVIGNLIYINHFTHKGDEHLEFFFHVINTQDYIDLDLSAASHAAEEIAELAFVDPKNAHILPEFLTTEPLTEVIGNPQPTKIFTYFD